MKSGRKWILFLLLTSLALCVPPLRAQSVEPENIPQSVSEAIETGHFAQTYKLDGTMNPFYLRGDFDGDGKPDYAFWIKAKTGEATGIAIWMSSRQKFIILGAGVPFMFSGSASSNFGGKNRVWQVYGKRRVEQGEDGGTPPTLVGEAIWLGTKGIASGLIYWDGKSFKWYQQGD